MSTLMKSANGDTSTKRVLGFAGFVVMAAISGYAIWKDPSQVGNVMWPWAVMIGAMVGATVLEKK